MIEGTVVSFDAEVGLGVVRGSDEIEYPFHCVEIADGSRDIAVGTEVTFAVMPKFGRLEAAHIET